LFSGKNQKSKGIYEDHTEDGCEVEKVCLPLKAEE
jgi:hypothetical protein